MSNPAPARGNCGACRHYDLFADWCGLHQWIIGPQATCSRWEPFDMVRRARAAGVEVREIEDG